MQLELNWDNESVGWEWAIISQFFTWKLSWKLIFSWASSWLKLHPLTSRLENQHLSEQEVALLVFRSQNLKTSFLCDSQGLSEPSKNLVQLLQWSFLIRTKARRMTGTVIPTRMAVLSGSVEMGCDQDVSLNLSLAELARIWEKNSDRILL